MASGRSSSKERKAAKGRFTEFECPLCDAYNPYDDGFRAGDDVLCLYCGQRFVVKATDETFRLKEY